MRAVSLSLCLVGLLTAACQTRTSPAWEIEPGRKIGALDPSESESELAKAYGSSNVRRAQIQLGEGESAPGTFIFPDDSLQRIEILWQDIPRRRFPARAILRGSKSVWMLPRGISLGTSLRELEGMNGRPFTLAGFAWDYEGVVFSWEGGALDTALAGAKLYLAPDRKARSDPAYRHTLGDREYSSSDKGMQQMNPRVYQIFVDFPSVVGRAGD